MKCGWWRNLGVAQNKFERFAGRRKQMAEFLRKAQTTDVIASVAEYAVMLFVAAMTGVSTLRLLGILP